MSEFNPAIDYSLQNEDYDLSGEITKEPNGGFAKYGINSLSHPNVNLNTLTLDQAKQIFEDEYWSPNLLGNIIIQQIATKCLDCIINIDEKAKKIIQQVAGVEEDGFIGPVTIAAINILTLEYFTNKIVPLLVAHYTLENQIAVAKGESYPLDGLLARARKMPL